MASSELPNQPQEVPAELGSQKSNALADFARSAAYAAAAEPTSGIAQIVDHYAGTHLDASTKAAFKTIGIEPTAPAEFGTASWYAQQLGGASGLMVTYGLLHKGMTAGAGRIAGEAAVYKSPLDIGISHSTFGFAKQQAVLSGTTGYIYGLLRPGDENKIGTDSFWAERRTNAAADAAFFGTLGFVNPYMGRALGAAASAVERSTTIPLIQAPLKAVLTGPVLPGVASGLPVGIAGAEINAWKDGRRYATATELKENIVGGMVVGGVLGGTQWLGAQRAGTDRTNARHITDNLGLTNANPTSSTQAQFRLVSGHDQLRQLYEKRLDTSIPKEAQVTVRQSIDGALSGLFGRRLGDVRSMLVYKGANGEFQSSLAADSGLIATCLPLPETLQDRDVFPGRSQANPAYQAVNVIWSGGDSLTLTRAERPSASTESSTNHSYPDDASTVHLGRKTDRQAGNASLTEEPVAGDKTQAQQDHALSVLTDCLSNGQIDKAKQTLALNSLTEEQVRAAARQGLESCLKSGMYYEAGELLQLKLLNDEDLKTDAIRNLAYSRLQMCIRNGRFDSAKELLDFNLLTENDLKADKFQGSLRSMLASWLSDGEAGEVKRLVDFKLLADDYLKPDATMRAAARAGLAKCLADGSVLNAERILDLKLLSDDDLKSDEIRDTARSRVELCLSEGWLDNARQVIGLRLVSDNDLKTDAIRKAARSELISGLSKGWIDHARHILDFKLLTADDLNDDAIRKPLTLDLVKWLEKGNAANADDILNLKLLTADDLKADAIREAAAKGLIECVSKGWGDDARRILDLNLFTENDLKDKRISVAASEGFRTCLMNEWIDSARQFLHLKLLDQDKIDDGLQEAAQTGAMTGAIRTALANGTDFNTALKRYFGIAKLTDESAEGFYAALKGQDGTWKDKNNVQRPFEEGATVFGAERMLRYAFKANATPHDALHAFRLVTQLQSRSGLAPKQFYDNILSQVSRDDAMDGTGSSFSRMNEIARSFPADIDAVLQKAQSYPEIKTLQELVASIPDQHSVFASWPKLQRFAKLQQFVERVELLPELQQLRAHNQHKLADWIEALAFHPDSKVTMQAVTDFWKDPEVFLNRNDLHSAEAHNQKKPSNYTDIPHLGLSAPELRDALIDGTLDRLQVFSPMKVEYEVGGNDASLVSELSRALGSRRESQPGEAKNIGKLFSEANNLLKTNNLSVAKVLSGAELSPELARDLVTVLYDKDFGVVRPSGGLKLVAQIHKKSDPLAVVAGDDTASCMGFGTGKNNIYMFNPNNALFTVRLVRADGTSRTIAQSVLTKDKDVKVPFPDIMRQMKSDAALHTIFPEEALRGEKTVIAADNVQVHPSYVSGAYPAALEAVYGDFFGRYTKSHAASENLRGDKLVIGLGYSSTMQALPKEPNTFVPQAPLGYSDKTHDEVISLSLHKPLKVPLRVLNVEDQPVAARIAPPASTAPGISPLTFEDTLPLAYLEGKAFQDTPSLRVGLHNVENALIAKDISNAAKARPNLSLKYSDQQGKMKGYLLAYEGNKGEDEADQPVIFISDFTSDREFGTKASLAPSVAAGKLLLEFGKLYKENYLDRGQLIPIFTNARDKTSYNLLMRNIESLGNRFGYRFEVQEIMSHKADSSTMHDVLIVPHQVSRQ